jgi:hypothetical protein
MWRVCEIHTNGALQDCGGEQCNAGGCQKKRIPALGLLTKYPNLDEALLLLAAG